MRLLLVIYSGPRPERVHALLEAHHAVAYTTLEHAKGAGATGRREGSRAWPGEGTVVFSLVPDDRAQEALEAVGACQRDCLPGERIHAALLPVEGMV